MGIPTKRKGGSVPLCESNTDDLIGKAYLLKCWVIKNELAQDIFKYTRTNKERDHGHIRLNGK